MAYNNFPIGYQPYYPQSNHQQNNSIIWVQGEAGAKSYLVAPNTTVQLWDAENQVIYIKSADASGMPSMRVIDYTFRDSKPMHENGNFVTQDQLNDLKKYFEDKLAEVNNEHSTDVKHVLTAEAKPYEDTWRA